MNPQEATYLPKEFMEFTESVVPILLNILKSRDWKQSIKLCFYSNDIGVVHEGHV